MATEDDMMSELRAAAATAGAVRPSVHTLKAQQDERSKYEAARQYLAPDPAPRKPVTATQARVALVNLLERSIEGMLHASSLASILDGAPSIKTTPGMAENATEEGAALFATLADLIGRISKAIEETDVQLKRIDEVLS